MSSAEIDYISKFDFTKGFSSWHIQWPVKNILEEDTQSSYFKTTIEDENSKKRAFEWHLYVDKCGSDCFEFGLRMAGDATLAIIRTALCGKGKKPMFNQGYVLVAPEDCLGECDPIARMSFYPADLLRSYVCKDMILHCWIDIPNGAPKIDNRKRNHSGDFVDGDFRPRARVSLSAAFSDMFKGVLDEDSDVKTLSDVTLRALDENKERRSFYCHRNVLSVRSSVSRRMFANENWKETANKNEGVIEIEDVDAKTLEYLLKYIYTGALFDADGRSLPFPQCGDFLKVIHAADKYNSPELIEFCSAVLISRVFERDDDRIEQLLHADRYRLHQLKAGADRILFGGLDFSGV